MIRLGFKGLTNACFRCCALQSHLPPQEVYAEGEWGLFCHRKPKRVTSPRQSFSHSTSLPLVLQRARTLVLQLVQLYAKLHDIPHIKVIWRPLHAQCWCSAFYDVNILTLQNEAVLYPWIWILLHLKAMYFLWIYSNWIKLHWVGLNWLEWNNQIIHKHFM